MHMLKILLIITIVAGIWMVGVKTGLNILGAILKGVADAVRGAWRK